MQKKHKKLTACAVAAMLGLSCMVYPVHAQEVQSSGQVDTGGLLEVDETAVPVEENTEPSDMKPEVTPTPEAGETVTVPEGQPESEDDKEEIISEPMEMEQETQPEATEQTNGEAEPQEQNEIQKNSVLFADTTTFNINENSVNITQNGTYIIEGTGQTTTNTISIAENLTVKITLDNVDIDVGTMDDVCAFEVKPNANLILTLDEVNSLRSGSGCAGLKINDAFVTINGLGSLRAVTKNWGEGIEINNGILTIESGTITANGGDGCAGIGGSNATIIINNGNITANGHIGGAGIGQNSNSSDTVHITINGGTVNATASKYWGKPKEIGSSIGYCYQGSGNVTVTINGGNVNAPQGINPAPKAPTPTVTIAGTTASSIMVNELENKETYGGAEYRLDGRNWQASNVFRNLNSSTTYTVYARYKGNDVYKPSDAGKVENASTNAANYTITIPAEPVEAGNSESKAELKPSDSFDVGYGGTATVKVKKNSSVDNDGKLTLTRQNDTGKHTITSALLVNNTALGNIDNHVAAFTMDNKTPVSVSFAKPTDTNIPAGTYNGTITFEVSYSEQ